MTYVGGGSGSPLRAMELVKGSYRILLARWRDCLAALTLPAVIDTLVRIALARQVESMGQQVGSQQELVAEILTEENLIRMLAMLVVNVVALTLFAVSWHRLTLVGERPRVVPAVGGEHVRFALLSLALIFITTLITLAGVRLAAGTAAGIILLLALIIAVLVYLKLSMLFPAAALDVKMSPGQSWAMTRGSTLTLFWAVVLGSIPAYFVLMIVATLVGILLAAVFQEGDLAEWIYLLIQAGLSYLPWAIVIGIVSDAYRQLAGPPPSPAPSPAPSPGGGPAGSGS